MDVKLNDIDRRVLGVLMEKEMSQPDYYPMTLNAVVAACNQKQNRDPVMSLDEVAIEAALARFAGQIVDLLAVAEPATVWADHGTAFLGMAAVVFLLRPAVRVLEALIELGLR